MCAVNPIQNLRHLAKPRTFIHGIRNHPMGEEEKHPQKVIPGAVKAMIVDTMGSRVQVSWDKESWLYAKSG